MNIPKPRDASQALRQAKVQERADRLFQDGYRARYIPEDDVILIRSDEGNSYRFDCLFETCTCPFYKENDYCKHGLGAQKLLKLSDEEAAEIEAANALQLDLDTYRRHKAEIEGNPFYGE